MHPAARRHPLLRTWVTGQHKARHVCAAASAASAGGACCALAARRVLAICPRVVVILVTPHVAWLEQGHRRLQAHTAHHFECDDDEPRVLLHQAHRRRGALHLLVAIDGRCDSSSQTGRTVEPKR